MNINPSKIREATDTTASVSVAKQDAEAFAEIVHLTGMEEAPDAQSVVERIKNLLKTEEEHNSLQNTLIYEEDYDEANPDTLEVWLDELALKVNTMGQDPLELLEEALRDIGLYLDRRAAA
ncbi:hypothetical protein VSS37_03955 [Candidatus Thiothrix sp. Deng01]|uniref:Uncharacterized protein n=1 Tax=Candidatus Thiothrix phosphatis TaxID=3112415 RepID=A0ABU6CTG1_9GAMM|nr:hypothetical protein [Candidatus Thiothrix sp. Deng01]MEB4590126.1 hypothetical protein [Candidatus Thiothrix sp. Deng01]